MKEISTKVSSSVYAQHKSQLNKAIKKAAEDTMKLKSLLMSSSSLSLVSKIVL